MPFSVFEVFRIGIGPGFGETEFRRIGALILAVLTGLRADPEGDRNVEQRVRAEVSALCKQFPIYPPTNLETP